MLRGVLQALGGHAVDGVVALEADAYRARAPLGSAQKRQALSQVIGLRIGFRDGPAVGERTAFARLGLLSLYASRARATAEPDPEAAAAYACTTVQNLPIRAALVRAADALRAAGIPAIAYKGQDYVERVYNDLGARAMADADLLVRSRDRKAASQALVAAGFAPDRGCRTEHEQKYCWKGVAVDLHHRLFQRGLARVDHEALFERAVPSPIGHGLLCLEATDAALVHCVAQTIKGYALPASSYVELAALIAQAKPERLIARARAYRTRHALYVSLRALAALGCRRARSLAARVGLSAHRKLALAPLLAFANRHRPDTPGRRLLVGKALAIDQPRALLGLLPRWLWGRVGPPRSLSPTTHLS